MSVFDFSEKVVLVTGGASGIGRACVETFAAGGARVVIADRDKVLAQQLVAELEAGGAQVVFVETDVADPAAVSAMLERTLQRFGALHYAVNNAGIEGENCPVAETSLDNWHRVIDVNLNGVFYCMREEIPAILQSGGGAIVNLSSIMGSVATPGISPYVSSKHAVLGLTKTAAQEYSAQGLRVNAVCPGFIETPMVMRHLTQELREQVLPMHPIGRLGTAQDVANSVAFLCSDQAAFVTGSAYNVDGGYLSI
jgi:NAD(P)-dependent dehydrogenase (short-subunit alcohol dehydrogenase family)